MFISDNRISYTIGDFVFTRDGRNGRIVASFFDDEQDIEFYRLDTTGIQIFSGADLSVFAPGEESPFVSAPLPPGQPVTGLVDFAQLTAIIATLRQDLLARIDAQPGVTEDRVIALAIAQVELFGQPLAADLRDLRNEQVALHQAQGALFEKLESLITIGLSEIGTRLDALDERSNEVAGVNFLAFLGQVGEIVRDPLAFLLERGADVIQQEILDGLNR